MSEHCAACGVSRDSNAKRGGHVGHAASTKFLWFCFEHYTDTEVREQVVNEAFGELKEERRKLHKPRTKAEAKEAERIANARARFGTPTRSGVAR